jgi:integrase
LLKLMRHAELLVNGSKTDRWRWQAIRDQAMICLMIYAGLREGEVVALDVEDVEIGKRKGTVTVRRGKGDKSRLIPLNKEHAHGAKESGGDWSAGRFIGNTAPAPPYVCQADPGQRDTSDSPAEAAGSRTIGNHSQIHDTRLGRL